MKSRVLSHLRSTRSLYTSTRCTQSFHEPPVPTPALFQSTTHARPDPSQLRRTRESAYDHLREAPSEYTPPSDYSSRPSSHQSRAAPPSCSDSDPNATTATYTPVTPRSNPEGEYVPREKYSDDDFLPFDYALERRRQVKRGEAVDGERELRFNPGDRRLEGGRLESVAEKITDRDGLHLGTGIESLKRRQERSLLEAMMEAGVEEVETGMGHEKVEGNALGGEAEVAAETVAAPEQAVGRKKGKKAQKLPPLPSIPLQTLDEQEAVRVLKKAPPRPRAPNKRLSPEAEVGIRLLHAQHPHLLTPDVLSKEFGVSYLDVQKILKARWKITPEAMARKKEAWWKRGEEMKQILGYKH